jgi:hypothetical protein
MSKPIIFLVSAIWDAATYARLAARISAASGACASGSPAASARIYQTMSSAVRLPPSRSREIARFRKHAISRPMVESGLFSLSPVGAIGVPSEQKETRRFFFVRISRNLLKSPESDVKTRSKIDRNPCSGAAATAPEIAPGAL